MKKSIIISSFIIILTLIGGGVFLYLKQRNKPVNPPVAKNEPEQSYPKEMFPPQPNDNQKYQGETVKEADGWKKYTNKYFGVEFRFRDEGDKVGIFGDDLRLVLGDKENIQGNPDIYIDFFKLTSQYVNFIDYLKIGWNDYQEQAKLIAITPQTNKQGTSYYSVSAKVNGGMQSPGITYTDTVYYFGHHIEEQNLKQNDKKNYDYIKFSGGDDDLTKSVISSFKF